MICCGIFQEKGIALVSPRDTKAPRVLVPLKDCPEGKLYIHISLILSVCLSMCHGGEQKLDSMLKNIVIESGLFVQSHPLHFCYVLFMAFRHCWFIHFLAA